MLSIIVPTFNEKDNIEPLIRQISSALSAAVPYEILFIDDSTDETPQVLQTLCDTYAYVRYLHRTDEKGLASAVVKGFSMAQGDVLVVMDADLQHPPELLPDMYRAIENGADIVLPSRNIEGGEDEGLNWFRKLASTTAKLIGKVLLPSLRKISDPTSGYFMLKKEAIASAKLRPLGWKILMEVLVLGTYKNVVELPYAFQKRLTGESKISFKVTMQYFAHIFSLLWRSERERRFYLFLLVGLSGVVVDTCVYLLLSSLFMWTINILVTMSAVVAMCSNYILNRNLTWASTSSRQYGNTWLEFLKFAGVSGLGILIKNVFVYLITLSGVSGVVANLIGIVAASLFNYFFSKHWVFSNKAPMCESANAQQGDIAP